MKCFVFVILMLLVLLVDCRPQDSPRYHRRRSRLYDSARGPSKSADEVSYVFKEGVLQDRDPVPLANRPEHGVRSHGPSSNNNRGEEKNRKLVDARPVDASGMTDKDFDIKVYQETRILINPKHKIKGHSPYDTMQRDGDFVFPTENNENPKPPVFGSRFKPVITSNCKQTFCEDTDFYPADYVVNTISNRLSEFGNLFGNDELTPVNITQRIDASDEMPLCQSKEDIVFPKAAENMEKEWVFVINEGPLQQGVRIELCISDPQKCQLANSFPSGYEGSCKQKFIYRKLVALKQSGDVATDNFRFPSCCTCYYKKTAASLARLGDRRSPAKP